MSGIITENLNIRWGKVKEMKPSLLEILCCPKCKGDLELHVFESDEKSGEIISGDLYCKNCDIHFPIEDGIPNMLLPEQRGDLEM